MKLPLSIDLVVNGKKITITNREELAKIWPAIEKKLAELERAPGGQL